MSRPRTTPTGSLLSSRHREWLQTMPAWYDVKGTDIVSKFESLESERNRLREAPMTDLPRLDAALEWREEDCLAHRVIVCGTRKWKDRDRIADRLFDLPPSIIVHGNAPGADRIAAQEALKLGLLVEAHPADWERFGKRAGPIRNVEMAKAGADLCIAFWDGQSTGTAHMIDIAQYHGIPVEVIR